MRVFAISDVHADYPANLAFLEGFSRHEYAGDTLILAGDVSDNLATLERVFKTLGSTFARVFFVPGNHELWVRRGETCDSPGKFRQILDLCASLGLETAPRRLEDERSGNALWIVPLFSWYVRPEEGEDSLFVPRENGDPGLEMWADMQLTKWPSPGDGFKAADYFLRMNEPHLRDSFDAPVVSFSHFLPRRELIFRTESEPTPAARVSKNGSRFNFSRVAGSSELDGQIRQIGARVHVYGHQHRNRNRLIDRVRYISHCLGYPHERLPSEQSEKALKPLLVWDTEAGHRVEGPAGTQTEICLSR